MTATSTRAATAAVCIVLLSAALANAQGRRRGGADEPAQRPPAWFGKAEIKGTVIDQSGQPVADAKVTLVCVPVNAGLFVTTNKKGAFEAKGLKAGEWRLQVDAKDQPAAQRVVQLTEDKNPSIDIRLGPDYRAAAFAAGRAHNHEEALRNLDLALAQSPGDILLLQLAAASAMELKDYARAMGYLAKVDEKSANGADVLVNAALGLLNRERKDDAIAVLNRVVASAPAGSPAAGQAKELLAKLK